VSAVAWASKTKLQFCGSTQRVCPRFSSDIGEDGLSIFGLVFVCDSGSLELSWLCPESRV
jgi:hypothetical protein